MPRSPALRHRARCHATTECQSTNKLKGPKLIIALGRRYVQYINRSYRRTGTLWDSRYKSSLIQAETYLLDCMRTIELNPVRAAMVDDPAHYRWTSYRANALGQADALPRRTASSS